MITDGTINPAGVYVEQENHSSPQPNEHYLVQHGGQLYTNLSPKRMITPGRITTAGNACEVYVNDELVYSERPTNGHQPL